MISQTLSRLHVTPHGALNQLWRFLALGGREHDVAPTRVRVIIITYPSSAFLGYAKAPRACLSFIMANNKVVILRHKNSR